MALSYLPVDRDQAFLLPPDMRAWLPEGHLVWFVLDVVERLDTGVLHARHPNDGVGRRAYDPDMLLALLVYAYCSGMRSSRRIERLCEVDVAYRVIAANHVPDHTTIARFRQGHEGLAVQMFTDVLVLCHEAGLARLGVVAVDGTKIGSDASLAANRTREQVEAEVRAMFAEAATADLAEDRLFGDERGDELPADLADPRRRKARLDAALAQLEAQAAARRAKAEATQPDKEQAFEEHMADPVTQTRPPKRPPRSRALVEAGAAVAREEARNAERIRRRADYEAGCAEAGKKPVGFPPLPESRNLRQARRRLERIQAQHAARATAARETAAADRVNTTDPDSRIMKTPGGWIQGYNAQTAVNEHGVALAAEVTQDENDYGQCQPMISAALTNLSRAGIDEPVGTMLFDAGYLTDDNLTAAGPDRLIATGKAWKMRRQAPTADEPPEGASPLEAMEHRLRTPEGRAMYAKRSCTVEPVFGDVKEDRGFRRFMRRGLTAADAEWKLILTTHNIRKLYRQRNLAPDAG